MAQTKKLHDLVAQAEFDSANGYTAKMLGLFQELNTVDEANAQRAAVLNTIDSSDKLAANNSGLLQEVKASEDLIAASIAAKSHGLFSTGANRPRPDETPNLSVKNKK